MSKDLRLMLYNQKKKNISYYVGKVKSVNAGVFVYVVLFGLAS